MPAERARSEASGARRTPSRRPPPWGGSASPSPTTATCCGSRAAACATLNEPDGPIDCGNAGTLIRLLPGILAGQTGRFELVGDESLSRRPLDRIAEPLRLMGVTLAATDGHAPLCVEGGRVEPIRYELPVASAQVKSCVLLAGLYAAEGSTTVVEPAPSRDHTERMLVAAGVKVSRKPGTVTVWPAERLRPLSLDVPGDFSSAAPFLAAASLLPGSEVRLHGIGINPTERASCTCSSAWARGSPSTTGAWRAASPSPTSRSAPAELTATAIGPAEVPTLIDELPLFALCAAFARGESAVTGAHELRVKETDRIESRDECHAGPWACASHRRYDGFRVRGVPSRPKGGGVVDSRGDHRIAMLGALGGLLSREGVDVRDAECVAVSFPGFFEMLDSLAVR